MSLDTRTTQPRESHHQDQAGWQGRREDRLRLPHRFFQAHQHVEQLGVSRGAILTPIHMRDLVREEPGNALTAQFGLGQARQHLADPAADLRVTCFFGCQSLDQASQPALDFRRIGDILYRLRVTRLWGRLLLISWRPPMAAFRN